MDILRYAREITTAGGGGRLTDPEIETNVPRCIFEFAVLSYWTRRMRSER